MNGSKLLNKSILLIIYVLIVATGGNVWLMVKAIDVPDWFNIYPRKKYNKNRYGEVYACVIQFPNLFFYEWHIYFTNHLSAFFAIAFKSLKFHNTYIPMECAVECPLCRFRCALVTYEFFCIIMLKVMFHVMIMTFCFIQLNALLGCVFHYYSRRDWCLWCASFAHQIPSFIKSHEAESSFFSPFCLQIDSLT